MALRTQNSWDGLLEDDIHSILRELLLAKARAFF
jgi:hypothetical protein